MGKKRAKKTADSPPMQPKNASPGAAGRWVAVGLLVLGAGVFLYALNQESPSARSHDHGETAATSPGQSHEYRYFASADDARPFPVTLSPSRFQSPAIANAYAIAKEIPEVLVQQPCLCGCDNTSDDHRSLLDCYIDEHAATCMVCVKEAVFAKQMTDAGKSGAWIRDAIVRHEFSDVNIGS
jgi:hypothetical protein